MTTFNGNVYKNSEVQLDGNRYTRCTFDNCSLVYSGGEPPTFENCNFRNIKLQLSGDAAGTRNYLQSLYAAGLDDAVERVMERVKTGAVQLSDRPAPPPQVNVGDNYRRLGIYAASFAAVIVLLGAFYVYGTWINPYNLLENRPTQPLISEVSLDLMPVLPETLADEYEMRKQQQLDLLNTGGIGDAGESRIPIDDAIDILLSREAGFPTADDAITVTFNLGDHLYAVPSADESITSADIALFQQAPLEDTSEGAADESDSGGDDTSNEDASTDDGS